jgi:macrolide transport system ATP-binding/permease protein
MLAVGIGIGVLASLRSTSLLKSMLYGTGARNPLVLMMVSAHRGGRAGLIAAFSPARRAASVDPRQALRAD